MKKYVYVIAFDRFCKIGVASNINTRLKVLQTSLPVKLELITSTKEAIANAYSLEKYLHKHFQDKKTYGEWFLLDQDDIDFIRNGLGFYNHGVAPLSCDGADHVFTPVLQLVRTKYPLISCGHLHELSYFAYSSRDFGHEFSEYSEAIKYRLDNTETIDEFCKDLYLVWAFSKNAVSNSAFDDFFKSKKGQ